MQTIEKAGFFDAAERESLRSLDVKLTDEVESERLALAVLMLAPLMQLSTADGATTTGEFGVVESIVQRIESSFELATKEELESAGTAMGMLPFVPSAWKEADFVRARQLLVSALMRLPEDAQHAIREFIAKGALEMANASGGLLHLLNITQRERSTLHHIIEDLSLDRCAEGLHLIGKIRDRATTS